MRTWPSTAAPRPERSILRGWKTTSPSERITVGPSRPRRAITSSASGIEAIGERIVDQEARHRQQLSAAGRAGRCRRGSAAARRGSRRSRARCAAPRRSPSSARALAAPNSLTRCSRRSAATRSLSSSVLSTSRRKTTSFVCGEGIGCAAMVVSTGRLSRSAARGPRGRRRASRRRQRSARRRRPAPSCPAHTAAPARDRPSTGSTTAQAASTASWLVKSEPSPAIASSSSRSYVGSSSRRSSQR